MTAYFSGPVCYAKWKSTTSGRWQGMFHRLLDRKKGELRVLETRGGPDISSDSSNLHIKARLMCIYPSIFVTRTFGTSLPTPSRSPLTDALPHFPLPSTCSPPEYWPETAPLVSRTPLASASSACAAAPPSTDSCSGAGC